MLRSGHSALVARSSLRHLSEAPASNLVNAAVRKSITSPALLPSKARKSITVPLKFYKPISTSLVRSADTKKHDDKTEQGKLVPHPEQVSVASSVHPIFHEQGVKDPGEEEDVDMLADIKSDWKTARELFALEEVPKKALVVGLAGVLPYFATAISTTYLAWDINHASLTGEGFLVSGPTAEALLHVIEPLQIGYGAVIISFIGAIHWGLEWAKYGGEFGYSRYAPGIIAPAVAWPTTLMPIEYALITQFCAFTFLYFTDARAVIRGAAPSWYSTYRFVLTFFVGSAIVVTLVGRGQIVDKINRLPSPADRVKALRDHQLEAMEEEERYKQRMMVERDEKEGEENEESEDEAEDS